MRAEIRPSTSNTDPPTLFAWRVWENGRLLARGQSASAQEAEQAVRALVGPGRSGPKQRTPLGG